MNKGPRKTNEKGKPVRPIRSAGIVGKQYRRLIDTDKRISRVQPHPWVVAEDLKRGSLVALDAYLKKNKRIPDREVALALSKLISGSAARSNYRLVVVDHPDRPPDRGGRPKSKNEEPTRFERELYVKYLQYLEGIGKKKEAWLQTAQEENVGDWTVRRAIAKCQSFDKKRVAAQKTEALLARRKVRLDRLRKEK